MKTQLAKVVITTLLMAGTHFPASAGRNHLLGINSGEMTVEPSVPPATPVSASARLAFDYGRIPLIFIPNHGQFEQRISYAVQARDMNVYFSPGGLTYQLFERENLNKKKDIRSLGEIGEKEIDTNVSRKSWVLKLDFVGCRRDAQPESLEASPTLISYFRGKKVDWKTGIRADSKIIYRELWPGIDLLYSGTFNRMKYEFIVRPGADPAHIKMAWRGAESVAVDQTGQLKINTPLGEFTDDTPVAWQGQGAERDEVKISYKLHNEMKKDRWSYGFEIGDYDRSRALVLDPAVFIYCGYIGGADADNGQDIAVDANGRAYVTGSTYSDAVTFPVTSGAFQTTNSGSQDIFIARISADGTALEYCTYLGGSSNDSAYGIAVDASGSAYVTGKTGSSENDGFPVTVGPDLTFNTGIVNIDAFVLKLNSSGTDLVYCGYIGGSYHDIGVGIAVDSSGRAYVTGAVDSDENTFPVTGGPDITFNGGAGDAFVARVSADGTSLEYCGYIGGSEGDAGYSIAVDSSDAAYVTGYTDSDENTFPVVGGPDLSANGHRDAFVAKINSSGSIVYCGYIGGDYVDSGYGIAVGGDGSAYICGVSISSPETFPLKTGPILTSNVTINGFVAKITPDGNGIVYCGYIYTLYWSQCLDCAVDSAGNLFVTGEKIENSNEDAFLARINSSGEAFVYFLDIAGDAIDIGNGVAIDSDKAAYICGNTESDESSFPVTVGPDLSFNSTLANQPDAFVAKIAMAYNLAYNGNGNSSGTAPIDGDSPYLNNENVTVLGAGTLERDNHDFVGWNTASNGGGDPFSQGNTFFMPAHDITLYAQWARWSYVITATAGSGGTISPSGTMNVFHGENQTFTITPDNGFRISDVLVDGVSQGALSSYTFTAVTAGHTIAANFERHVFIVQGQVQDGHGRVQPEIQDVNIGDTALIEFTPDAGYRLASLSDNGRAVTAVTAYRIEGVNEDHLVVGRFGNDPPQVRIIQPLDGANIFGNVDLKVQVDDDSRVSKLEFFVDDLLAERQFGAFSGEYIFTWNSSDHAAGLHRFRVTATDEAGAMAFDEVTLNLLSITLTLSAQRESARAWSFSRDYGQITLILNNPGIALSSGRLLRKTGQGGWQTIKTLSADELNLTPWSYQDRYLEKGVTYIYVFEVYGLDGLLIGRSVEIEL